MKKKCKPCVIDSKYQDKYFKKLIDSTKQSNESITIPNNQSDEEFNNFIKRLKYET